MPSIFSPSAFIRRPLKILPLSRKYFQSNEAVTATIQNDYEDKARISLTYKDGDEIPIIMQKEKLADETAIKFIPPHNFKPGRYTLKITDDQNNSTVEEFTWGVLAINPNKSVYLPGELARIAIAVLDEKGNIVCNAKTSLEITAPSGKTSTLSTTDQTIKINSACHTREVTYIPDYETEYQISDEIGSYSMTLSAETNNGPYTVKDSFEVKNETPFDVERISATRIFPLNKYKSLIKIKANRNFQGNVEEIVPPDFEIYPSIEEGIKSYDEISTSSAALTVNSRVLGTKFEGNLSLPLKDNFPFTQGFANIPESTWLRTEYNKSGALGHDGIDFAVPMNTPIYAIDDGTVYHVGYGPYGKTVIIDHSWGRSFYGHLNGFKTAIDQSIKKGDLIAFSGTSGLSTGPHLHLTIKPYDEPKDNGFNGAVDPMKFLAGNTDSGEKSASSVLTEKIIAWNLTLKEGESITLGYQYKAPPVSPQFYLLGPLSFYSNNTVPIDLVYQVSRQWQIAADAITFTNLGATEESDPDINSSTDASSYSTVACSPGPCWTPPTSGLIILFVYSRENTSGNNAVSSITGNNLTWTQIATITFDSSEVSRLTLLGANASGSTQGQTTINFNTSQVGMMASFFYATGADLSGGVAAAFVQSPTSEDPGSTQTSGSVTLAAASDSNNRPISSFVHQIEEATIERTTPNPVWTEVDDMQGAGPTRGMDTQYKSDAFDTTASADWTTASRWGGIAAEIKMQADTASLNQIMKHGEWWNASGVRQKFSF